MKSKSKQFHKRRTELFKTSREADFQRIDPAELRVQIANMQIDNVCSERLGLLLTRIHDAVIAKQKRLNSFTEEQLIEARSWSLWRWLECGIRKIDLSKFQNPFSYIYTGAYLNMLNRCLRIKKQEERRQQYVTQVMQEVKAQFPGLQNSDVEGINEAMQTFLS